MNQKEIAFPTFDGDTFDYQQDFERLKSGIERVAHIMRDGKERTLAEVAALANVSESAASARLRDFRKKRFANHFKVRDMISTRQEGGLWTYRLEFEQGAS